MVCTTPQAFWLQSHGEPFYVLKKITRVEQQICVYISHSPNHHMPETRYGLTQLVNHNELELERFVDQSDTILPYFRIRLTGEHLAAWTVRRLRAAGYRCRRLVGDTRSARRATQTDGRLVFYSSDDLSATLIRSGREQTVTFDKFETPQAEDSFIHFITELMCDTTAV